MSSTPCPPGIPNIQPILDPVVHWCHSKHFRTSTQHPLVGVDRARYRNDIAWQATAPKKAGLTYADAGVSISTGDALVSRIKPACKSTRRVGCDAAIGGFGGLFDLKAAGFKDPILVSGTDGVGTKLEIAKQAGLHSSIGIDLVAMCVNDILAHGAEPLCVSPPTPCAPTPRTETPSLPNSHTHTLLPTNARQCQRPEIP